MSHKDSSLPSFDCLPVYRYMSMCIMGVGSGICSSWDARFPMEYPAVHPEIS